MIRGMREHSRPLKAVDRSRLSVPYSILGLEHSKRSCSQLLLVPSCCSLFHSAAALRFSSTALRYCVAREWLLGHGARCAAPSCRYSSGDYLSALRASLAAGCISLDTHGLRIYHCKLHSAAPLPYPTFLKQRQTQCRMAGRRYEGERVLTYRRSVHESARSQAAPRLRARLCMTWQ